ncbi:uncharacterized protein RHIMIDRAFT_23257 [Rhizopus microsporus ATCC 52813]|uniref:Mannosyltransferase n=2 Tax=Rhizopus microsporus TaxID=58291 RepID=A0A2G4SRE2_RHIZD|nr:uncharacterized protein RHIMIDRAFT_23257 [Rhizopus microsporus ATCC 52813]PHZ11348.1 hypothetical protein RHIMIDRAFT_23257 [Rhizopus microsporus ATCC 52813]
MPDLTPQTSTTASRLFIFGLCLIFRWINAYFTRTYDNPDEYWQGQEVAHNLVFGYGYLTWEWQEKIRSYAHPLSIAFVYKLVQILRLDNTDLLVSLPRYFQSSLTAGADYATYSLAKKVIGKDIALPILFTTLCSWFNFFMAARTLSNTMETILTVIALSYWPIPGVVYLGERKEWLKEYRLALLFASIACIIRPTNALIWLYMGCQLLSSKGKRGIIALNATLICSVVLIINVFIDTMSYTNDWIQVFKAPVFTPYFFFKVNVVNGISEFYGVHQWHWYLSQGLPVILTTMLPFMLFGLYCIYNKPNVYNRMKPLLSMSLWILFIYSLLPHKEFRFIYPIVPILLIPVSYGLYQIQSSTWRKRAYIFLVFTQLPLGLYLSFWHQRGVVDVMIWLRKESQQNKVQSVGVLMPCHSTPWNSILHSPNMTNTWFLTCNPPLADDHLDEADEFYQDPSHFLRSHIDNRMQQTSHLVLFDNLLPILNQDLEYYGYQECQRFFNSHFHDDKRRRGDVVVLCRQLK